MRKLCLASAASVLILLGGCSSMQSLQPPRLSDIDVLSASENKREYQADYDTTFQAAVDALRQIDNTSAKLVKRRSGVIVFNMGEEAGTITADVKKIDEQTTRVELSAKSSRKYWFDSSDATTREAFFREMDKLLKPAMSSEAGVESSPKEEVTLAENPAGQASESASARNALLAKVKQGLSLGEQDTFLEKLADEDLTVLEQRIQSFNARTEGRDAMARKCANCYVDMARVYHDDGQYERAAEALKIATAVDPENAVAHCNLGEIYKHLRRFDDAIRELNEAKELNPNLADTYINLGIIYDDYAVDDQKALENYKKYLELGGADKQVIEWVKALEKRS